MLPWLAAAAVVFLLLRREEGGGGDAPAGGDPAAGRTPTTTDEAAPPPPSGRRVKATQVNTPTATNTHDGSRTVELVGGASVSVDRLRTASRTKA